MNRWWVFLLIAFVVTAVWIAVGLYSRDILLLFSDAAWLTWRSDRGQIGDAFGVVNALFSGLAFAGVIYAILLQREDLQLQRRELELTRGELEGQKKQLELQNKTMSKQAFENTFFQMFSLHVEDINSQRHPYGQRVREGREVFEALWHELREDINQALKEKKEPIDCARDAYHGFYVKRNHLIAHYFRRLFQIVSFVDSSDIDEREKKRYTNLVRANLSRDELLLLFYNCLTNYGEGFKPLVVKYSILRPVDLAQLTPQTAKEWYPNKAFH